MAYSHAGHNCKIDNNVFLVNGATLGGYSEAEDFAYVSAFVPVRQWVKIGAYPLIGGGSGLNTKQAVEKLKENFKGNEDVKHIVGFINKSERGIVK